jgi:acetolactate synthase-1/2/3 large subunit
MTATRRSPARVADAIARVLARSGIRVAFGHPGGEVAVLIDALTGAGISFVLTHHENTAAFMAGGYGELLGRPGLCIATLGPGATNMATGVANAMLDRAPLIAITATLADERSLGVTHQKLDLNAMYAPLTKGSWRVERDAPAATVARALHLASDPRPGPVHLAIASDVAAAVAPAEAPTRRAPRLSAGGAPWPNSRDIDAARTMIERARRPAILVGLDAVRNGSARTVLRLAHAIGAAVATTPKAKGLFPEDEPLFAGVLEMAGDDLIIDFLRGADLILAVGLDVVELDKPWRLRAPVIRISDQPEPEPYFGSSLELEGPIGKSLASLTPARRPGWPTEALAAHRERLRAFLCPERPRLQPWQVVEILRRRLPSRTVATSDVGAHKFLVGQLWRTFEPRAFLQSNGLSAMGYGLPVAAVARLVDPQRPAVALIGDGGIGMYLGELETLRRLGLDLTILVFADGSLELIRRSQVRQQVSTDGTAFENPDFSVIARAFGLRGHVVDTTAQMERAAIKAATQPGIHLIAALISAEDYRL